MDENSKFVEGIAMHVDRDGRKSERRPVATSELKGLRQN